MTIYLDAAALGKLVVDEPESRPLRRWLRRRAQTPTATNCIGAVELQRLAARVSLEALTRSLQLLTAIDQLDLTPLAIMRAAQLPPPEVRTLDALHIASASELSDLEALVSYDHRMIAAARGYGLPVESPGAA